MKGSSGGLAAESLSIWITYAIHTGGAHMRVVTSSGASLGLGTCISLLDDLTRFPNFAGSLCRYDDLVSNRNNLF